jgi:hypothetical protein
MTKDEFEKKYSESSDVSVEWLRQHGIVAIPCDCGQPGCHGWQMKNATNRNNLEGEVLEAINKALGGQWWDNLSEDEIERIRDELFQVWEIYENNNHWR